MKSRDPHDYISRVFGVGGEPTLSGPVVRDDEVAFMLAVTADLMDRHQCIEVNCVKCNAFNALWWDWCMSLSGPIRIRLQGHLRVAGIALPPSPWEEVPTNAVPTALN